MPRLIQKVNKYGVECWEHTGMDALRKTECLCLLCTKLVPGETGLVNANCPLAQKIYLGLCQPYGMAMAVTRCPDFAPSDKA